MVIEGHSTDYQSRESLRRMVEDGVAILKVGPALTFALREGLFALERIERDLLAGSGAWMSDFSETLERAMLESPGQWEKHYHGNGWETLIMRKYSYSDRARYYLSNPVLQKSVDRLMRNLGGVDIPLSMVSQYLPAQYKKCREGHLPLKAEELLEDRVGDVIDDYLYATKGAASV
jgi:D-tagatose-1,6-bisphosphate aldolase subunit GatZ/KbaZ